MKEKTPSSRHHNFIGVVRGLDFNKICTNIFLQYVNLYYFQFPKHRSLSLDLFLTIENSSPIQFVQTLENPAKNFLLLWQITLRILSVESSGNQSLFSVEFQNCLVWQNIFHSENCFHILRMTAEKIFQVLGLKSRVPLCKHCKECFCPRKLKTAENINEEQYRIIFSHIGNSDV